MFLLHLLMFNNGLKINTIRLSIYPPLLTQILIQSTSAEFNLFLTQSNQIVYMQTYI